MALARVKGAVKYFPREDGSDMLVLDRVSFQTKEFGVTCLLGPSGCGKSTLLNAIAGLERLDGGRVEVIGDHRAFQGSPPRLGYVFQDPRLLNWKHVEANLTFALKGMNIPRSDWPRRLETYLGMVGLLDFRHQYPLYLSGGMRQRVGLARGLVIEPEVLLMDEPFSKLDQLTARRLREEALQICADLRQTTLMVTHDVEEAAYMGDRIIILSARPARVLDVFENPLPAGRRDVNDGNFIGFKKALLQCVLRGAAPEDSPPARARS
ncbi:MAG TPA: ABC transporter ATP-binding protein [Candidatus Eisenbacteria bacterium]|nr:ABC transporter ATP-binding protein [Candidatus Eisenbacteria bacterium]